MKVIFLDVDGVLNKYNTTDVCDGYIGIEDDKVILLKQVVDATAAEIVLSSTWRLGYNYSGHSLKNHYKYLTDKLNKCGLKIYDKTEDFSRKGTAPRGYEIYRWLSDHPEVEQWVVLDDEWFFDFSDYGIFPHWVHTNFYGEGLTKEHVEKAINILNGELNHEFE